MLLQLINLEKMSFSSALAALSVVATVSANGISFTSRQAGMTWRACPEVNAAITSSNGIEGVPVDCATLSVPLDYTSSSSSSLDLDLFRVNATQEPVLGSVLINFGGPGGAGGENLPLLAKEMAANIGPQWNLVSWDPRGTGKTIPFDCGDAAALPPTRKRQANALVNANLTEYFLNGGWESITYIADACAANATAAENGQYISTAFVARDMIEIVDALGEDGRLRYYGWSYGTALGSYVAAMFPDRVERIVLDGNLNPLNYQAGHYGDFLVDADSAFNAFLEECLANAEECSLATYANATSTSDMLDVINAALLPLSSTAASSVVAFSSYSAVQQIVFGALYYPRNWPSLADTITSLLNGTWTPPVPSNTTGTYNLGGIWPILGIRGSDATFRTNDSAEYLARVQYQDTVSDFDTNWPAMWLNAQWKIYAKERYEGNFSVKTAHPILYVNGQFDPVTPLADARNASSQFEGSAVLAHSGYGHGIVVSPSRCVAGYVQRYFKDGVLPENGTVCEPDNGPWEMSKLPAFAGTNVNVSMNGTGPVDGLTSAASSAGAGWISATWITIFGALVALYAVI